MSYSPKANPVARGATKDIWISARTDGAGGSGTEDDEYNASTVSRITSLFNSFDPLIRVRARPGNYLMDGLYNFPNIYLCGAGKGLTIFKLNSYTLSDTPTIITTANTKNNIYTRIRGVTFDGNSPVLNPTSSQSCNAVELNGDFITIEDCEAINMWGSFAGEKECFTFKLGTWFNSGIEQNVEGLLMKRTVARQFSGDYGSGFDIFAGAGKSASGRMDFCEVYDYRNLQAAVAGGFGFTGQGPIELNSCLTKRCTYGAYTEGPIASLDINKFRALDTDTSCVRLNGQGGNDFSKIRIDDSYLEINNSSHPSNVKWALTTTSPTGGHISDLSISNSRISLKNSGAATTVGFNVNHVANLSVDNLIVDSGLDNYFDSSISVAAFKNVRKPDGTQIAINGSGINPYS